jgi:hypothetical protein
VPFHRPFLLAALVSMALVARDGASEGQTTLEGPHYHYVSNKMYVPTSANQAREYALDLNNDGTVDNQFGMVLSAFANFGIDIQRMADKSVAEGGIILLIDLQKELPKRGSRGHPGVSRRHAEPTRVQHGRELHVHRGDDSAVVLGLPASPARGRVVRDQCQLTDQRGARWQDR